jgi:hypothetical protein
LRRDREFSEPPIELRIPVLRRDKSLGVVKPGLECEGQILGEKYFRSDTERYPVVEPMSWLPVSRPLEDKDRHNGKSVVGLKEQMVCDEESLRVLQEPIRVLDGRAEITGCALAVLNGKRVIASLPFKWRNPNA